MKQKNLLFGKSQKIVEKNDFKKFARVSFVKSLAYKERLYP